MLTELNKTQIIKFCTGTKTKNYLYQQLFFSHIVKRMTVTITIRTASVYQVPIT